MSKITVEKNSRIFKKDGKKFFYLADTCWSAFTNITMDEWEYYLSLRKKQGFNVLQINILPQWDASETDLTLFPFPYENYEERKKYKFTEINDEYFSHARKMCIMAKEMGFELALVVLWCSYVPGTWATTMINSDNIMPYEFIDKYVRKAHETFSDLDPMYIISGDSNLDNEEANRYYRKASKMLRELAPDLLQTYHICGLFDKIPEEFAKDMDFFMFQSGHGGENPAAPYEMAETFYNNYPVKPIINAEPCYEQMGDSFRNFTHFYKEDVRRAAWMSILSGASAGVTYGAHGIYSWQKTNRKFMPGLGEGFDWPCPWNDAIKYPGAWDYGYIKYLLDMYNADELVPMNKVLNKFKDIRMAGTKDQNLMFIYLPFNGVTNVDLDLSGYDIKIIDLTNKNVCIPDVLIKDGVTDIGMHNFERDALIVISK